MTISTREFMGKLVETQQVIAECIDKLDLSIQAMNAELASLNGQLKAHTAALAHIHDRLAFLERVVDPKKASQPAPGPHA